MKKAFLRSLCLMLALVLVSAICLVPSPAKAANTTTAADVDIQDGVTLHCWNWAFSEIEAYLPQIAAMGYTAIQTSPIQTAKQATKEYPSNDWWVFYQPADFVIDNTGNSALGTKADFQKMCATAESYGIDVIVDIVANHMGNTTANDLSEAIISDLRNDSSCWHDYTKNTTNYGNRYDVTQYCMAGLPDLNTGSKKVQTYVLNLLKECIDAGADGFRFDGAKHIETPDDDANVKSDFWPTIINGATSYAQSKGVDLYCYGEVLDNPGGTLSVKSYTKYMSVTDNTWGTNVLTSVIGSKNANAYSSSYHKSASADQLVIWAESHDTFADNSTSKATTEQINKTWALVASRADAMALYLARPANMSQYLGAASVTGWAYPEVAAVNKFHTAYIGQSEYIGKENGIAYVERGTSGVVLVNCQGNEADVSVTANKMANGTYTDAITGNTFTVAGGKISGKIGATGIAVVYDVQACAHETHDTEGFCAACSSNIGHSFDASGLCSCGKKEIPLRTIYFKNTPKWVVNYYSWYTPTDIVSAAWPGTPMTKVADGIYSCTIPMDVPNIIFNHGTGSPQTEDLVLPPCTNPDDIYIYNYDTGKFELYTAAPDTTPDNGNDATQPTEPVDATEPDESGDGNENNGIDPTVLVVIIVVGGVGLVCAAVVCIVAFTVIKKKNG